MKVVCVTPAGRQKYMSILAPYVLSDERVDEWQIWLNTVDLSDLSWLARLRQYAKVRLIEPPAERPAGFRTIGQFWRYCADENTIYVRLDDDIVWLEKDFFANLVAARERHPHAFLVSAMVLNNALCSYLLQLTGKVKFTEYLSARCMDPISWASADFARDLHVWAIKCIGEGTLPWRFGDCPVAMARLPINAICYFGRDIAPYAERIGPEEEEFVSCVLPTLLQKTNVITSDAWCAHFAFHLQREQLDKSGVLDAYARLMLARFAGGAAASR
ncbi:MAG: hypothetical protein ACRD9W_11165 [Terriglobia bacterium]